MPELPEVETIVRCLRPRLAGLTIKKVRLLFPPLLRSDGGPALDDLAGTTILDLRRRGKMILLDCSGGLSLLVHLKMTGRLFVCSEGSPLDSHTRLRITFCRPGLELRFRDVRKFGFVRLLRTESEAEAPELRGLGPEPFGLGFQGFLSRLKSRRGRIKPLLLNQRLIAGIGNIYADEILFAARIHPQTEAASLSLRSLRRLHRAMLGVLRRAIRYKGTSVRDYRDGNGLPGSFQNRLRVYGREGKPCPRCRTPLRQIRISGRSSTFCPRCQRRARRVR